MSDGRETGELLGFALTCVGGVLLLISAFVPAAPGAEQTLLESRRIPDGYGIVFLGGGFVTALFVAVAFLSEHGRYAVLAAVVAIATYTLAVVLAWGDAIPLDGRGAAIYLSVIGATIAASGAVLSALFTPDYFRTRA